jgi:tetratricopeptide (TPR) repeat protein
VAANDSLDFVQRGKSAIVRRNYAEAVKICRLGLLAHPTLVEGRLILGMALTALARWDEVLAEMRVALDLDEKNPLAWLLRGEALVAKGDLAQASTTLKRAKELDPSNPKVEQLLGEIAMARAAGFEGVSAEQVDTKVYPAKIAPQRPDSGVDILDAPEDSTQVDATPFGANAILGAAPVMKMPDPKALIGSKAVRSMYDDTPAPGTPLPEGATDTFDRPTNPFERGTDPRAPEPIIEKRKSGSASGSHWALPEERSSPGIELSSVDLIPTSADLDEEEEEEPEPTEDSDEQTRERPSVMVIPDVVQPPPREAVPKPVPAAGSGGNRAAVPRPVSSQPSGRSPISAESSRPSPDGARKGERPVVKPQPQPQPRRPSPDGARKGEPAWGRAAARSPHATRRRSVWSRLRRTLIGDRPGALTTVATALLAVILVSTALGMLLRRWRQQARVAQRYEIAAADLAAGTWRDLQVAEGLFHQIASERDEPRARALRARTLAQLAFEFGDPPEPATRAVADLGNDASSEAEEARTLLALIGGTIEPAARRADALRRSSPTPSAASLYLLGRVELARDHAEVAADQLRAALAQSPNDVLALHALGLAEANARRPERALAAYKRALELSPHHVSSYIDRAILVLRQGNAADAGAASRTLADVLSRLAEEASPTELARARLGLALGALAAGDVERARRELDEADRRRTVRDTSLSEELAAARLAAFDIEGAENEAKRGLGGLAAARLSPRLTLAQAALLRNRPADALGALDGAPARPEVTLLSAEAYVALGQRDEARQRLEAAIAKEPTNALRVALARVDIADGRIDRAQRDLDRVERVDRRADAAVAFAAAWLREGSPRAVDKAQRWLAEAIRRQPMSMSALEARLELVRLARESGQVEEARAQLMRLLALAPKLPAARRVQAAVALEAGDAKTARAAYDALATESPDPEAWIGAAQAALAEGDTAGADARVSKAFALKPSPAVAEAAAVVRARTLLAARRYDEAVVLLGAVARGAQAGEAPALLMLTYLESGDPDHAATVPLSIPPRVRNVPEVVSMRARLQLDRGRDVVAEQMVRDALARMEKRPTAPWLQAEAFVTLGRAQWDQGSFKPAQKSLRRAVELDGKNARAYHTLGLVFDEQRHDREAAQSFETALALDPQLAEAQFFLGRVRARLGDAKAADAYRAYLALAPRGVYSADARTALGEGAVRQTNSQLRIRRRGR